VVSEEGISTYPDKIKTVQDWPRPKTPKQMRGFLGLCDDVSKLYKVSMILHLHCCVAYLEMSIHLLT
jgi:hypothetical protein